MLGGSEHRGLALTAIQGRKAGQRTPIETRETQRLLGEQDHLIARRAALATKPENDRPTTGLIADIQMHHKKAPPEPHDHDAPGPSTAKGFEAVWTAPDEAP